MSIPFNKPLYIGEEEIYIKEAIQKNKICGDGEFTQKCNDWIETATKTSCALLTTSCTHAIEMAALLANIQPGDEIIMPSFTFVSTANPFVLRGAKVVFVDIRPDTMNIDEKLIEAAITKKTKAIVPVHYAGVGCEMDRICSIAMENNLLVIEDAAQGVMSSYKGKALGTLGDFGCFSFHETKNYSMGEGGAILVNDPRYVERAEIIREKGTNRSRFLRGQVDKYTWVDIGSSYLPSDLNAAFLYPQLQQAEKVNNRRLEIWQRYYDALKDLGDYIELPTIPKECKHNAHMFYIKTENLTTRTNLMEKLRQKEIQTTFHYVPLHSSLMGQKHGRFDGEDKYTTQESERLLRLPMFYGLKNEEVDQVITAIVDYFKNNLR